MFTSLQRGCSYVQGAKSRKSQAWSCTYITSDQSGHLMEADQTSLQTSMTCMGYTVIWYICACSSEATHVPLYTHVLMITRCQSLQHCWTTALRSHALSCYTATHCIAPTYTVACSQQSGTSYNPSIHVESIHSGGMTPDDHSRQLLSFSGGLLALACALACALVCALALCDSTLLDPSLALCTCLGALL